jgi:nucleoside phosphorylase
MADRNELLVQLAGLLSSQFEQVVFLARVPPEYLPSSSAPQATRAVELIRYLESHGSLDQLGRLLSSLRADRPEPSRPARGATSTTDEPTVIVLTALGLEATAVLAHLQPVRQDELATGTLVEVGRFAGLTRETLVGVVEAGQGNLAAAGIAQEVISRYQPTVILMVGVAGGIKDVQIGDVVAATKVYGYESGKADKEFRARPDVGLSSYRLVQRARAEARRSDWLKPLGYAGDAPDAPRVLVAPIAAGGAVVASTRSPVFQFLRRAYSDAVAVEMEGRGLLETAYRNNSDALVVRGISDLIDKKAAADAAGSQPLAARNAAAFAFQVLAHVA